VSVIAVRDYKHNLLHSFYFKDSTNKDVFKTYLKKVLLPNLPYKSYLVMDNASFHKGKDIEELLLNIKSIFFIFLHTALI
jgi:transposase